MVNICAPPNIYRSFLSVIFIATSSVIFLSMRLEDTVSDNINFEETEGTNTFLFCTVVFVVIL